MRMTYTDYLNEFQRSIGLTSLTSELTSFFQLRLNARYQLVMAKMKNFKTQEQLTSSTAAGDQYYAYPIGTIDIESVTVTIGSVIYPLTKVNSQSQWDMLNAIPIQVSALPQFVFPRRDDFGIWPIPQGSYTITFNQHFRDRALKVGDYTTGTATFTNGSASVTGTGTVWTAAMIGRWIQITDTSVQDEGYFYRIAGRTSNTAITLSADYQGVTPGAAVSYKIGQTPEIPEEGHIILLDGVLADYYSNQRNDDETAKGAENRFWTGDTYNPSRKIGDANVEAGLIGLVKRYSDRDEVGVSYRRRDFYPMTSKVFATTITGS